MLTEQSLLQFEKDWNEAIVSNNADAIAAYMSEDWVITGQDGNRTSKNSFLHSVRSGDLTHWRMDAEEMHATIDGNTGIVTATGTSAGTYKGEPFSFYELSMSTFVHDRNGWRCVSTVLSEVTS